MAKTNDPHHRGTHSRPAPNRRRHWANPGDHWAEMASKPGWLAIQPRDDFTAG